jgi:hypothetical protein
MCISHIKIPIGKEVVLELLEIRPIELCPTSITFFSVGVEYLLIEQKYTTMLATLSYYT